MTPNAINQVFIVGIISATSIVLFAIALGFNGDIEISCGGIGCYLKMTTDDTSDKQDGTPRQINQLLLFKEASH
jgi:hypothetical protein